MKLVDRGNGEDKSAGDRNDRGAERVDLQEHDGEVIRTRAGVMEVGSQHFLSQTRTVGCIGGIRVADTRTSRAEPP